MNFIVKLLKAIRNLIAGSDSAESFFKKYISCFLLIVGAFILILISKFHTQGMYRDKLQADRELQSIEAVYNQSNEKFKNSTLNSRIIDEIKRRNIAIERSVNPPIIID